MAFIGCCPHVCKSLVHNARALPFLQENSHLFFGLCELVGLSFRLSWLRFLLDTFVRTCCKGRDAHRSASSFRAKHLMHPGFDLILSLQCLVVFGMNYFDLTSLPHAIRSHSPWLYRQTNFKWMHILAKGRKNPGNTCIHFWQFLPPLG